MINIKDILSSVRIFLLCAFLLSVQSIWAVDPSTSLATYYANIDGKATDSNDALRVALCTIISTGYTSIGYSSLQNSIYAASSDPSDFYNGSGSNKTMEDIYSSYSYKSSDNGSSASGCGEGWNKEHTVPQSWFNEASPMKSDAHHVFPTDIHMNSTRSSYPYGENNASKTCSSGYGHLGASTFSGYSGQVFDPGDGGSKGSYKGDLARVYFYMVTRYRTTNFTNGSGGTSFTYSDGVANLTDYMKNLMLKWHKEDPVSEKELIRNNAIYAHQHNRNPFVDYPCLVEYIWGDRKGETVTLASLTSAYSSTFSGQGCPCTGPTIVSPATDIFVGSTSGATITKTITVHGENLESGNLSLSITGTDAGKFSLSSTSISKANAEAGYNITITYTPGNTDGTHTATLNISGCGLTSTYTVSLSGTRCTTYDVILSRNGIIETVSTCGAYTLPTTSEEEAACDGWAFKGWITGSSYNSTTAPTYVTEVNSATTLYAVYGKSLGGSGSTTTTLTMSTYAAVSGTFGDFTFAADQNGGSSAPTYNQAGDARLYASNTLTISGSNTMTQIVFNISAQGLKRLAPITANVGTIATQASGDNTVTWTGEATSVTFTVGAKADYGTDGSSKAGQLCYTSVNITNNGGGGTMTYKTNPCTTYTVTLTNGGTAAHGSFEASASSATAGTTITLEADADEGYELSDWSVTQAGGGNSVTVTNNQFTMPEYDVVVSATFVARTSYSVTWKVNGSTYTAGYPTTAVYSGERVVSLPTAPSAPSGCSDKTFVGWSATNIGSTATTDRPTDLFTSANESPVITGETTFYAIFGEEEESTTVYDRVTNLSQLDGAGSIVIVNAYSSSNFVLTTDLSTAVAAPTESNGQITVSNSTYKWNLAASGGDWTFGTGNSYLGAASMPTSSNKSADVSLTNTNKTWSIVENTFTGNGENCFTIYNAASSTAGLEYSSGWKLYYAISFNTSWYTLKLYVPAKEGTYVTNCSCTVIVTAESADNNQGSVSIQAL